MNLNEVLAQLEQLYDALNHDEADRAKDATAVAFAIAWLKTVPHLFKFATEFVDAWEDGMAGDSSFLIAAKDAIAKAPRQA